MTINGFEIRVVRTGETIWEQIDNQKYVATKGETVLVSKSMESLKKRIKKLDGMLDICRS